MPKKIVLAGSNPVKDTKQRNNELKKPQIFPHMRWDGLRNMENRVKWNLQHSHDFGYLLSVHCRTGIQTNHTPTRTLSENKAL